VSRYTSPDLSRQLKEAGLDQKHPSRVWYRSETAGGWRLVDDFGGPPNDPLEPVRALDLTDVLAELTRPRPEEKDARPLCEKVYVLTHDSGRSWNAIGVRPDEEVIDRDVEINGDAGERPVDVAALVLLALLKERS